MQDAFLSSLLLDAGPLDLLEPLAYVVGFLAASAALGVVWLVVYLFWRGARRWRSFNRAAHSVSATSQLGALLLMAPMALAGLFAVILVVWAVRIGNRNEAARKEFGEREAHLREEQTRAMYQARINKAGRYVFADTVITEIDAAWEEAEAAIHSGEARPLPTSTRVVLVLLPDGTFTYRSNIEHDHTRITTGNWEPFLFRKNMNGLDGYEPVFYTNNQPIASLKVLLIQDRLVIHGAFDNHGHYDYFPLTRFR